MNYLNTAELYVLFQNAVNSEYFVDESMLVGKVFDNIWTENRYVHYTLRRFGKSVNAHMLGAYYTKGMDSGWMFDNLKIAQEKSCSKHRNGRNVIFADTSRISDLCGFCQDYISVIREGMWKDLVEFYLALVKEEIFLGQPDVSFKIICKM